MTLKFWSDEKEGQLELKLFSEVAESYAKKVHDAKLNSRKDLNNPTQLRKFYDEILSFNARFKLLSHDKDREEIFKKQLPHLMMLIPKVKYSQARNLVSKEYSDMLCEAISGNLKKSEDLSVLVNFLEAFMGYYKFYYETRRN